MISFFKNSKVEKLEDDVKQLKKELQTTRDVVKQLHDTICVLTAAQYQIGSDVGVIYSTLKSLANPTASPEDDMFSFKKDDDDKGYLN